jgi:hypothetical protein
VGASGGSALARRLLLSAHEVNLHVSPNRLEGSLCDTSLDRLLGACRKHLVTGAIQVTAGHRTGSIELRAGAVDAAVFGMAHGERAVELMAALPDGHYELTQKLPDLDGGLGAAAVLVAGGDMSLVKVLRHCEHHALSCTIVMVSAGRRGEIEYRAGEIARAACAGLADIDAIVEMKGWADARIEVVALPLDLGIEGWPRLGRAPTAPFTLGREHPRPTTARIARGTGAVDSVDTAPAKAAPAKDPHDESARRKATVTAPAPAPKNPRASLPKPRKALPPSSAAAPPAPPAEPAPLPPVAARTEPTPVPLRAPTAVRGSASSPGGDRGKGSKRRARTTPRVVEKRAADPRPTRDATAPVAALDIIESGPVPTLPTLATARANPTPLPTQAPAAAAAPIATGRRSRHAVSNPRAVEARQQVAAAAYRSPRPVVRHLVPPPPPGRRAEARPATRIQGGSGRWALYAAIALTFLLGFAIAIAAVTGIL